MISLHGYEKRYGKLQAVKPLDLTVKRGEIFALLGPNGSGKSTIIRSIAGLQRPTSGKITIDNQDIYAKGFQSRKRISYMPQRVSMPNLLTAREILNLFAELRDIGKQRLEEMLDFVELEGDADRQVREFSGGMLQRLGLAVTLLEETEVMVLDEPTLNLDQLGIRKFRMKIKELKTKGVTIIFSSHILQDAAHLADRVGILVKGKMAKVENVPVFRSIISNETAVHLVLESTTEAMLEAVYSTGAIVKYSNGHKIVFNSAPEMRLTIIRAIESAGGKIEEFRTESPDWESLIQQSF